MQELYACSCPGRFACTECESRWECGSSGSAVGQLCEFGCGSTCRSARNTSHGACCRCASAATGACEVDGAGGRCRGGDGDGTVEREPQ